MMMRSCLVAAAGLIVLNGCQTAPGLQLPAEGVDYGIPPQIDPTKLKEFIGSGLKDAESARYKFGEPLMTYCNHGLLGGGKLVWTGWSLPLQVNAKNSYGAYTGYKSYIVRYDGDSILDVSTPTGDQFDFVPQLGTGCSFK